MKQEDADQLRALRGCVASVCTTGLVENAFAQCRENMRSLHDREGFHAIEYLSIDARLVETGRDSAVKHAIDNNYAWLVQCDADATFSPDAVIKLLHTAFIQVPQSDMVGAYCQLKGSPYITTIDTGTSRWEEHYPGEGVIPVIRTGGHFMLCKRSAFEKTGLQGPWFRTRQVPRSLDTLAELDGIARQKFSGQNPFSASDEWKAMMEDAVRGSMGGRSSVGEDSAWCDLLKSRGGQIFVNTDVVTGHVSKDLIGPAKMKKAMQEREHRLKLAVGAW